MEPRLQLCVPCLFHGLECQLGRQLRIGLSLNRPTPIAVGVSQLISIIDCRSLFVLWLELLLSKVLHSACVELIHRHSLQQHITETNKQAYTVNHKKRDILFLTIALANLNRFLQFLYHFNREEILHATIVTFTTSPEWCAHLTS